jgi:ribokinase
LSTLDSLLPDVEYLIVNVTESELLAGWEPGTLQHSIDNGIKGSVPSLEKICSAFFNKGVSNVIITLGSNGIYLKSSRGQICSQGVFFHALKAKVVDTTGAGDTFLGALAAALASSGSSKDNLDQQLINAVLYARHAAAMSVEKSGAQTSIPTAEEVGEDKQSNSARGETEPLVGPSLSVLSKAEGWTSKS